MKIALSRFELPSSIPKTDMLDHYTTGLYLLCGTWLIYLLLAFITALNEDFCSFRKLYILWIS